MEPRGLRNNNPGNIRTTKDRWQGLRPQQTDPAFFQFTEMRYGYRALIITCRTTGANTDAGPSPTSSAAGPHRWRTTPMPTSAVYAGRWT